MKPIPSDSQIGKRLITTTVDEIATHDPSRLFAIIPRTLDLDDGFSDVTFSDFACAIDKLAFRLEKKLGKSTEFETLAYMGPADIAYFMVVFAAVKVGYKVCRAFYIHYILVRGKRVGLQEDSDSSPFAKE
jgi:hypothetical protein